MQTMTHTKEPLIQVGILFEPRIEFVLYTPFHTDGEEDDVRGQQAVRCERGKVCWRDRLYDELLFIPVDEAVASFELLDVTIGINFHWQRKEDQRFRGALKFIVEDDKLTAVNLVRTEEYLASVISSEMSANASPELLKAHAIISRSWLMRNLSAHTRYNVCADDHCQRYQGITRATTDRVRQAVDETRGKVLTCDGEICDARYSKCCGGVMEEFQYAWEDVPHAYLKGKRDSLLLSSLPDLMQEAEAERWIRSAPEAFCHTADRQVLEQVLNSYDQETVHFFRWQVAYTQAELADLIRQRSGTDYGGIVDLIPVARGTSGRIWQLRIVGTKCTQVIGKELTIRRTLSASHLYSSAFIVDKEGTTPDGLPARFLLTGAGWGHGVGLCQIGAAVMSERGYDYEQILLHYYTGAQIESLYE
ncbi:MAG: SpoIID/LytB domain-containing protein [Prevotellaceae bacterium]|jgi:SpoIID/LytB domain protein|nr:SpoIID/LytB domain-containing protein [Prevotellaceae bacterium]